MNRLAVGFVVSCVFAGTASAAMSWVRYPVRHLVPDDAVLLIRSSVPEAAQTCTFNADHVRDRERAGIQGVVAVSCESETAQARVKEALAAIDVPPPTHRFHIAVLAASRKEGPTPELPPGEAKALADFRKVMTYRSFQMEAETVLQTERGAEARFEPYVVELHIDQSSRGGDSIDVRMFKLRGATPQQLGGPNSLTYPSYIETSFSIKGGETLVLGTTVSDQQARVVLVTALP
jgi:hypothetical protein